MMMRAATSGRHSAAAAVVVRRHATTSSLRFCSAAVATPTGMITPSLSDAAADEMVAGIVKKQRRHIARAVTLSESTRPDHAASLSVVLAKLRQSAATKTNEDGSAFAAKQRRIAISGSPGAGKSCFIDALGNYLCETLGLTVGVLAVDPSSTISGGSILGDKTRMERLAHHDKAFVRPSPSSGHLGGVTARCWETLEIFEAANFDVTLIETVGVGQSETEAAHLSDLFVLLVPPASGDELQGVKKGIVEMADAVIVTKRDGPRVDLADATRGHYKRAVMLTSRIAPPPPRPEGLDAELPSAADCMKELEALERRKPVIAVSAETGYQIAEAWAAIDDRWKTHEASGKLAERRRTQRLEHFNAYLAHELVFRAQQHLKSWSADGLAPGLDSGVSLDAALKCAVEAGAMTPRAAGDLALERLLR